MRSSQHWQTARTWRPQSGLPLSRDSPSSKRTCSKPSGHAPIRRRRYCRGPSSGPVGRPFLAALFIAAILLGFPAVSGGLLPVVAAPVLLIWGRERVCFGAVAGDPAADRAGLHANPRGYILGAHPGADRPAWREAGLWLGCGVQQVGEDAGVVT